MKIAILLPLLVSFMACGDLSLEDISEKLSEETGLPVEMNTVEHDECTMQQLRQIGQEFKSMPQAERSTLLENIKDNFDKIVVEKSSVSLTESGKVISLVHFNLVCSDSTCWYEELNRKVIEDNRRTEGERLSTTLKKEERILGLQVYSKLEAFEQVEMMTTKEGLYDQIEASSDPIYIDALEKKAISQRRVLVKNKANCDIAKNLLSNVNE